MGNNGNKMLCSNLLLKVPRISAGYRQEMANLWELPVGEGLVNCKSLESSLTRKKTAAER
jgi:hypothetical protein